MKVYKFRLSLVAVLILILASALLVRLGYLFIVQKQFFKQQGDARTVRTVNTPAYRGLIFDRNGKPLAVSTAVMTIWANPSLIISENYEPQSILKYHQIDKILDLPGGFTENKILENKTKEFIYIKRHLPPDIANKIIALELPGIFIKKEFKRYYPNGEVTAHITGFTSIDDAGQEGLEYAYEDKLKGVSGKQLVLKDRLGRIVKTIRQESVAKPGDNIDLSIDLRLQYLTYKALKKAIDKHDAHAGIAIVVNINSGEILALANQPSFNPNDKSNVAPFEVRNRALTDLFEPGSLLKPLSMASVLSTGKVADDILIDTTPGYKKIGKNFVRDVRNYGVLDLDKIIKKSSNIGISQLTLDYDSGDLVNLLYKVGFTQPVLANFPGEAQGWINDIREGQDHELASLSFGYGLTVTPLQLIQAYSIFANNGRFIPITINKNAVNTSLDMDISSNIEYPSKQIVSPEIANRILGMLNGVMQSDGTGRLAMIANYQTAGKTGTTRRVTKEGYDENSHNSMFIGLAPYPKPKFAMLVFIIDPKQGGYYGGSVAGPVFKEVMPYALQLYGVSSNKVNNKLV